MDVTLLRRGAPALLLALLAAAGLAYDAYVHLHLAPVYDHNGSSITQGALFRVEAGFAVLAALALLLRDDRLVWLAVGLTGLGGAALVVLYRYVDVGALGPLPDMYEPVWYGDKTRSAVVEAGVGLVWLVREALRYARARSAVSAASAAG